MRSGEKNTEKAERTIKKCKNCVASEYDRNDMVAPTEQMTKMKAALLILSAKNVQNGPEKIAKIE